MKTIIGNRLAPGLLDRLLARIGYTGQLTDEPKAAGAPDNLFESVPGPFAAHGRFDARAAAASWEAIIARHRAAVLAGALLLGGIGLAAIIGRSMAKGG